MKTVTTHALLPLTKLAIHPENVRAKSPETYTDDEIATLAESIKAVGLINALTVQKVGDDQWGVLAGGRRLAALQVLAADQKSQAPDEISCNIVPDDFDGATALSFAENDTVVPMHPIDEYDAFARMLETGMAIDDIAKAIGQTETAVRNRLKFANVAPELRAAARAKDITLDVMKAFAEHPDHAVQMEVYQALIEAGNGTQAWAIKETLRSRGLKASDSLAQLIIEDYQQRNGAIAGDLLPEFSVLTDTALIEELLLEKLQEAAEAARRQHGLAWADATRSLSYEDLQCYGRVYPQDIEPDEKAQQRIAQIAERTTEIESLLEDHEGLTNDEYRTLDSEYDRLSDEARELQEAYTDEDRAKAGVIAHWGHGSITLSVGLVKPEHSQSETDEKPAKADPPALTQSLKDDLAVERAMAVGAALCTDHALADDLLKFKVVTDALKQTPRTHHFEIRATVAERHHTKADQIDTTSRDLMAAFYDELDTVFLDERSSNRSFDAFRKLKPSMKSKLVAYAMAQTLRPRMQENDRDLFSALESSFMPNIRDYWRPTGGAFFARLTKAKLLTILSDELGMPNDAVSLSTKTKSEIVAFFEKLFAEPFSTLTDEQRLAVSLWTPEKMQTQE